MTSTARYRVRLLPAAHEMEVELRLAGLPDGPVRLQTPTWVPGAYGFMKYGRDLFDVRATDSSGAELPMRRDGWAGYLAEAKGELEVHFKAYASDPAWGELVGIVAADQALLLATHFLFAPAHQGPCRVEYQLPNGWELHHPSGAKLVDERTFEYESFAALLDTPIAAGRFDRRTRQIGGVPFHFVFFDDALGFSRRIDGFLEILARVAEQCRAVFGGFPFADYSFLFTFDPRAEWGLEHANATTIQLDGDIFVDDESQAGGVRVCAHELFHAFNVCRLKPAPLGRLDLDRGGFPDALWVSEGLTRYYEFLLLARAGVLTPAAFFSNVVNYYSQIVSHPAYERVSLLDSSRSTFLNHSKYPGSVNATIDYYDKGMLVAFDLDVALRTAASPDSLDGAFAAFYKAFVGKGEGFTHADFAQFLAERAPGTRELLAREVEQPGGLSVVESLQRLGFDVHQEALPSAGLVMSEKEPAAVANVVDQSPAGQSGIAPLDVIERVNGHPFSAAALAWAVANLPRVVLSVNRGGRRLDCSIDPAPRRKIVSLRWQGTEEQAALVRGWLGRPDFRPAAGEPVPLGAFANFHGIQRVL
jgi:predicted metalloprotease with PDZ domain